MVAETIKKWRHNVYILGNEHVEQMEGKNTNSSFTRPCEREEKQREVEEDLDGQCQGRPEGDKINIYLNRIG